MTEDDAREHRDAEEGVWYFAYGSNLDPERFVARVGEWAERRRAVLRGHVLRFSGDVLSEGGGGAIFVPGGADDRVHGAILRIGREQIEAMDREEFTPSRDLSARGVRRSIEVDAEGELVQAEVYVIERVDTFRAPSARYLEHILRGLAAVGYDESVIESVRAVAATEPADD